MSSLVRRDGGGTPRCAECQQALPVGPCAACEGMICGDCGVMTTDPGGRRVICLSCARLVAAVDAKPLARRPAGRVAVAVGVLIAFGLGALALLG